MFTLCLLDVNFKSLSEFDSNLLQKGLHHKSISAPVSHVLFIRLHYKSNTVIVNVICTVICTVDYALD